MLITALNLLFSELHSNVICATKFFSEMLSIKSTCACSYVLWELSMALLFWAAANHWCFPWFKMSCCTWASFKTLVFVEMLTAKFWAYLNPQSEPQFQNVFLKKLSQCCFLESSRRNAWINQCWCPLLTSLLRKKKTFGRQHQGEQEFYSGVLKQLSQCCFLESFKKKHMDKSVLMYDLLFAIVVFWILLVSLMCC